jgi:hypothetical protein
VFLYVVHTVNQWALSALKGVDSVTSALFRRHAVPSKVLHVTNAEHGKRSASFLNEILKKQFILEAESGLKPMQIQGGSNMTGS